MEVIGDTRAFWKARIRVVPDTIISVRNRLLFSYRFSTVFPRAHARFRRFCILIDARDCDNNDLITNLHNLVN